MMMTSDPVRSPLEMRGTTMYIFIGAATLLFAAGLLAGVLHAFAVTAVALRWIALSAFALAAFRRRSLLLWTFLAMLAGAELGTDLPLVAANLHFIGEIFLRLIRMIVAPLIFGGIVTGIAGHGELRGVGRVALKSIFLFEIVTTLGLVIGTIAINVSQAGMGIALPAAIQTTMPATHPSGWQDILLNIFPENIAQAVAQNQIL